jgi:hypothetical protein
MLYVVVLTVTLSGAALAAEYAARLLRRTRSRLIWALAIIASLVVPRLIVSGSIQVPSVLTPTVSPKATPIRELTSIKLVPLTWVHEHTGNTVAAQNENRILRRAWVTLSVALFAGLIANSAYVFWRKRRWRMGTAAGVSVYIAPDVGPAVVGLLRPHIVVPAWLAESSPSHQAIVIAHEQEHLSGHDLQLLTVGWCLVVLMPWNVPLWWQLHRLRYAIEVDCDARVIKRGLDTRQYGQMLIDVSQRPSLYLGAVAAISESRSFLERRITLMARASGRRGSVAAVAFGSVALILISVAVQVTPPTVGSSDGTQQPVVLTPQILDRYVGFYVRGATMVTTVRRDGARLLLKLPGRDLPEATLVADSETVFHLRVFSSDTGPSLVFLRDARGDTTSVVWDYGTNKVSMPRVDASVAQTIKIANEARARSNTPVRGSDAALRRLIDGIRSRNPNYREMSPWFAELVRDTASLNEEYVRWGAVQSIEFRGVNRSGYDMYEVHQVGGTSSWFISLGADGRIEDADNYRW